MRALLFVLTLFLAPMGNVSAETREQFAAALEAKTKSASCGLALSELDPIPGYKECGGAKEIGTDAWFKCANGVDRANRAIFYWNVFVESCGKSRKSERGR